jgi:hypothetical protein
LLYSAVLYEWQQSAENHFDTTVLSQETMVVLLGTSVFSGLNTLARSGGYISSDSGEKQLLEKLFFHTLVQMPTNTHSSL